MTRNQKSYKRCKEKARLIAIEWQLAFTDREEGWYWSELAEWTDYFRKIGKRYGLLREFAENGII